MEQILREPVNAPLSTCNNGDGDSTMYTTSDDNCRVLLGGLGEEWAHACPTTRLGDL